VNREEKRKGKAKIDAMQREMQQKKFGKDNKQKKNGRKKRDDAHQQTRSEADNERPTIDDDGD